MNESSEPLILGIDLGGSKILTAVVNARGKMLSRDHSITPAAQGTQATIQAILDSTNRALAQASVKTSDLGAIGIGAPGLSNPETGILYTSPNLPGWQDVPLRNIIENEMKKPSFLINDANAAALGEFCFGAGKGLHNFIYITISTGIGGGIIINDKIYTGASGAAGEVGHMTIKDDGPLCHCGNRGCWETLASGTAMAREARQKIKEGARTSILDYTDGEVVKVTAEVVQKAAQQGDNLAKELISQTAYYVGVGLANLINLFNPQRIVIGGGVSQMGDMLLQPAYNIAGERAFKEAYRAVSFAPPELGRNSGVIGAASFALSKII